LLPESGIVLGFLWWNRLVCSWHSIFSHVGHIPLIAISLKALRVCVKFDITICWTLKMLIRIEKNRQLSEEYSTIWESTASMFNPFSIGFARFLRVQHRRASAKISVPSLEPSMKFPLLDADAGFVTVPWFPLERPIFTLSISRGIWKSGCSNSFNLCINAFETSVRGNSVITGQ
jgi:hypothetical protein